MGDDGRSYWTRRQIRKARLYQWHVYAWAREILLSLGGTSVLDVGCGPGIKLKRFFGTLNAQITGTDQKSAVEYAAGIMPSGEFIPADVETELPELAAPDLIIACDVIEHLRQPDQFLETLKSRCGPQTRVIISTPDRDRLHGPGALTPRNTSHVCEWAWGEFSDFLEDYGFCILEARHFPPVKPTLSPILGRVLLKQLGRGKKWRYNMAFLCRVSG